MHDIIRGYIRERRARNDAWAEHDYIAKTFDKLGLSEDERRGHEVRTQWNLTMKI